MSFLQHASHSIDRSGSCDTLVSDGNVEEDKIKSESSMDQLSSTATLALKQHQQKNSASAHEIVWAVATETGYKNIISNNGNGLIRMPIHAELEDVHWPSMQDIPEWSSGFQLTETKTCTKSSSVDTLNDMEMDITDDFIATHPSERVREVEDINGSRIFVLADGHGGVNAPRFFVPAVRQGMASLLSSRSWDLTSPVDQAEFETAATELFKLLDAEYCATQVELYQAWLAMGSPAGARPVDDGCTLVVTLFHRGVMVNMNVGDSRTVLYSRPVSSNDEEDWVPAFTSVDHNMTHPGKVHSIHTRGGHFLNPNGTLKYVNVTAPETRCHLPYNELLGARIYRAPCSRVKAVGVSHKRTLNLSGTMGDLLFKIEPAVLTPEPDVKFLVLDARRDYVVVMGTDGVWDHLSYQGSDDVQNERVLRVVMRGLSLFPGNEGEQQQQQGEQDKMMDAVAEKLRRVVAPEEGVDEEEEMRDDISVSSSSSATAVVGKKDKHAKLRSVLSSVAEVLVARENVKGVPKTLEDVVDGLYTQRQTRYDDCTAFVALLKGSHL